MTEKKNQISDGSHMCVFGRTRSGKTHYVKWLLANEKRYIVFDPDEEFNGSGIVKVHTLPDLKEVLNDCCGGNFRIAFIPTGHDDAEVLHSVSETIFQLQSVMIDSPKFSAQNITFVVDEMADTVPNANSSKYPGFLKLARRGAKRGVSIIGISQRPADVATKFRSQAATMVSFAFSAPHDFQAVMDVTRGEGAEILSSLKPYHSLVWSNEKGVGVQSPV